MWSILEGAETLGVLEDYYAGAHGGPDPQPLRPWGSVVRRHVAQRLLSSAPYRLPGSKTRDRPGGEAPEGVELTGPVKDGQGTPFISTTTKLPSRSTWCRAPCWSCSPNQK